MAKYASNGIVFQIDKADGGALQDMTSYITKIGDLVVDKGAIESTPFGVTAPTYLAGVLKRYQPFTIEGFYDDTAVTGPDVVFNVGSATHAVSRSIDFVWGGGKKISGEVFINNYKRGFDVGNYHTFSAELVCTGTITEA